MAESLSFLSNEPVNGNYDEEIEVAIRSIQEAAAIGISEVVDATKTDPELQAVKQAIMDQNWSSDKVKPYSAFKNEISHANDLVMRGSKLVIPVALRERMLILAHEGHPGQTCMKRRLRDRCWWPNMDSEAVKICDSCEGCRLVQIPDPPQPMQRRPLPEKPWVDIAIDFLGPLPTGEYILVVVDYFSRHVDLEIMRTITAGETIKRLTTLFNLWGVPRTITLDNAKQFANGEVERQNRSLLKRLKIADALYGYWKAEMQQYLEMYNNSPHSTTGKAPNELLQNRRLRSKFPDFQDLETSVGSSEYADKDATHKLQGKEREDARRRAKPSDVSVGDTVLMRNLHPTDKLSTNFLREKFIVEQRQDSKVKVKSTETGRTYDRNVSHLKKVSDPSEKNEQPLELVPKEATCAQRRSERVRKPPSRFI
ncbi:uncharacterized protein K02A2.6-like [Toxorhynchites rutilus septentrionalis]|uniref:uncharacterized protein K02A2.6-like n=1 Tax=Toxorhynchites rutilus septentrionalis TaxID=329112 RepID=UPI00247AC523|nr:uncharacterized protein K02A2.6-like [Toxorhynchites rutilus septentrionalis]